MSDHSGLHVNANTEYFVGFHSRHLPTCAILRILTTLVPCRARRQDRGSLLYELFVFTQFIVFSEFRLVLIYGAVAFFFQNRDCGYANVAYCSKEHPCTPCENEKRKLWETSLRVNLSSHVFLLTFSNAIKCNETLLSV
jgi:hypothetical protein